MQGSDCNSVSHSTVINQQFSRVIPNADIVTVEKYGITESVTWNPDGDSIDCPEVYLTNDSPKQRVNDYLQVIDLLQEQGGYKDVVLLGGSEGAVIAAMVASENKAVSAVISINGGGRFFIDDIVYSMSLDLPPQAFKEAEKGIRAFHKAITHSDSMAVQMSGHGFLWWKGMLDIDQTEYLLSVKAPLLVVQSELDRSVSPVLAAEQSNILRQKKRHFEYLTLKGMDHKFKDPDGVSQVMDVIELIRLWVRKSV